MIDPDISPKMELWVQLNRLFISLLPCYPSHSSLEWHLFWLAELLNFPMSRNFSPNTRTYHKSFIVQRNGKGKGDWVSQEIRGKVLNLKGAGQSGADTFVFPCPLPHFHSIETELTGLLPLPSQSGLNRPLSTLSLSHVLLTALNFTDQIYVLVWIIQIDYSLSCLIKTMSHFWTQQSR